MAYSYDEFSSKTSGDTITVSFPAIDRDHVYVVVSGVDVSSSLYEWISDGLISCLSGFPSGDGRVERRTPTSKLPASQSGAASYDWRAANENDLFLLYQNQERADKEAEVLAAYDGALASQTIVETKRDEAVAAAAEAASSEANAATSAAQASADASQAATNVVETADDRAVVEAKAVEVATNAVSASTSATQAATSAANLDAYASAFQSYGYLSDWGTIVEAPGEILDYGDITT
jgi:hypothetical protein